MSETEKDPTFEELVPEKDRELIGTFSCGCGIPCRFCGWMYCDHFELRSAIVEEDWVRRKPGYPLSISSCVDLTSYFPEDLATWQTENKAEDEDEE